MNEKKIKVRKVLTVFIIILAVLAGGVLFVLTHTQIIVGMIQKLSAGTVNTANVYESLGEPMEGLKDNGQYVITEIKYSDHYPNSYLDITYPNRGRDASNALIDPLAERGLEMAHCFVASERVDDVARDAFERMIDFLKNTRQ